MSQPTPYPKEAIERLIRETKQEIADIEKILFHIETQRILDRKLGVKNSFDYNPKIAKINNSIHALKQTLAEFENELWLIENR